MARNVIMPKTGMAMEEGTIVRWLKKPGDTVSKGEAIAVIETDKVTMDLEADDAGTLLAIVHGDGEVVKATDTIAWIGEPGENVGAPAPAGATGQPALPAPPGRIRATPSARRLAAETGVALASLKGTGPGGAIRARDVTARAARTGPTGAPAQPTSGTPMTGMRKLIAERMLRSHQTVPAVTLVTRADVTELAAVREKINAAGGARVSFTDFIVRAVALALREHPLLNSAIHGELLVLRPDIAIGVAVALENGLIVPVVRAADTLSVRQVSARVRDLSERARAGTLSAEECSGGSFTITNLGMHGITEFTPLINVPESAILGVGAIEEALRRGPSGDIESRRLMSLCLTHDHRHIDGAPAAAFLGRVRSFLESCWTLLA